jgi:NAD-dependent deacetylase
LAKQNISVVTQNVDNLHVKAEHPSNHLIEIHGNINFKRKINAAYIEELELANWNQVDENNLEQDLFDLFKISKEGIISETQSYRPHILLFDEYYTELYQYDKALTWIDEADTIIFMGTSNSVGFTYGALQVGIHSHKKVMVVDPNPASSFNHPSVAIIKETATDFCARYF